MRHRPSDCDTWGQTAFETDAVAWIATISLFYFILTNNTNTIAGRDQRSCIIMAIILAYIWKIENAPCFVFPHKPHKKRCGTAKYWTADLDNSWKYATFRLITHTHTTHSLSLSLSTDHISTDKSGPQWGQKQSTGRELLLTSGSKRRKQGCIFSVMNSKIREEEMCVWLGDSQYVSMCELR